MARARRQKAEEKESGERWLLTYADLITLLMVFFVVLYSMSQADSDKFKRISAALQQAFNIDVLKSQATATSIKDGQTEQSLADNQINDEQSAQVARLQSKIKAVIDGLAQAPDVSVGIDREGIVIRLSGSYLF